MSLALRTLGTVYMGHRMVHDPNPRHGRTGVKRVEEATFFAQTVDHITGVMGGRA